MEEMLAEHIALLCIPAFSGSMIGHIDEQFTIPLGIEIEIDADNGSITMLDSGVVCFNYDRVTPKSIALCRQKTGRAVDYCCPS